MVRWNIDIYADFVSVRQEHNYIINDTLVLTYLCISIAIYYHNPFNSLNWGFI